jgi:hypothetical protein
MVACDINGNRIFIKPIKLQKETELIRIHKTIMDKLCNAQIYTTKQLLDNKISNAYQKTIMTNDIKEVEHVQPNCHKRNAAEKAIQTFKNLFKSILYGCDDSFPMHLFDHFGTLLVLDATAPHLFASTKNGS